MDNLAKDCSTVLIWHMTALNNGWIFWSSFVLVFCKVPKTTKAYKFRQAVFLHIYMYIQTAFWIVWCVNILDNYVPRGNLQSTAQPADKYGNIFWNSINCRCSELIETHLLIDYSYNLKKKIIWHVLCGDFYANFVRHSDYFSAQDQAVSSVLQTNHVNNLGPTKCAWKRIYRHSQHAIVRRIFKYSLPCWNL